MTAQRINPRARSTNSDSCLDIKTNSPRKRRQAGSGAAKIKCDGWGEITLRAAYASDGPSRIPMPAIVVAGAKT
jgi:hypothetical protein